MPNRKQTHKFISDDPSEEMSHNDQSENKSSAPMIEVVELEEETDSASSTKDTPNSATDFARETPQKEREIGSEVEPTVDIDDISEEAETDTGEERPEPPVTHSEPSASTVQQETKDVVEEIFKRSPEDETDDKIKKEKPQLLLWSVIVIVAALTLGIGLLFITNTAKPVTITPTVTVTPSSAVQPTVTPTPIPQVTKDQIKIQILNGGGVVGAAGKMKSLLEEKGYNIENVGNADAYDYAQTVIKVKPGAKNIADLLTEDLAENYTLSSASGVLESTSPYDALIIIGKE